MIAPTITLANHVQLITVSNHDTNAADKKNNAHADKTIIIPTNVIADNKTVSFSTVVNFK